LMACSCRLPFRIETSRSANHAPQVQSWDP
jgi:hypothetical protein